MSKLGSKRRLCGHCNEEVSKTLYYRHRQQFYDEPNKKWCKIPVLLEEDPQTSFSMEHHDEDLIADTKEMGEDIDFDEVQHDGMIIPDDMDTDHELSADEFQTYDYEKLDGDELVFSEDDQESKTNTSSNSAEWKAINLYLFFLFMFQSLFRCSDTAIGVLLSLFGKFLKTLGVLFKCKQLELFSAKLPVTISKARTMIGNKRENFKRYVCCPKCSSIIPWNKRDDPESLICEHILFPNHSQIQHRKPCGESLFKKVKTTKGKTVYRPILVYCYKSIVDSLQEMLSRPGFINNCEAWRNRKTTSGLYQDVYDGKIWEDFLTVNDKPFLSLPYNFALQLNVDWFQPFTHTTHSEGVIYMSIMNLPRSERFKQENAILIGVMPGPHEAKKTINSFLSPLVEDLLKLWEGVILNDGDKAVLVRGALLCSGCDIPAARKTCGFVGHSARLACSKCLLVFPTANFGEKPDFSNFNRSDWIARTNDHHRENAEKHRQATTRSQEKHIEHESGVRFSVLLKLPYFDAPRMTIIDPMHNLFLGTAKKMMKLWKEDANVVLRSQDFAIIQEKVDSFVTTKGMGRLPFKIETGFAGFTAEQWKNWCLYFSLFALKDTLPRRHFQCWQLFCKACYYLCRRQVTANEIDQSDVLFEEFCKLYVTLYGKENCTINLHLHCHLADCVKDFGPVYAFWLFSYERFNGIMGSYHTNGKNISVQLTHRFLDSQDYTPTKWPAEYASDFLPILEGYRYQAGSLMQATVEDSSSYQDCIPLSPVHECMWKPDELLQLKQLIENELNELGCNILMLTRRAKGLVLSDFTLSSATSRYSKSDLIFADRASTGVSLAQILYFSECKYQVGTSNSTEPPVFKRLWVIAVKWSMEHPCRAWYGYPSQVWSTVQRSTVEFIPISRFRSRAVYTTSTVNFGRINGCIPVIIATPVESICIT